MKQTFNEKLVALEQARLKAIDGHNPVLVRRIDRKIATLLSKLKDAPPRATVEAMLKERQRS